MAENTPNRMIKNVPYDELQELLNTSNSYIDVLRKLYYQTNNGNNINTLKKRIMLDGFDTSLLDVNRKESQDKHRAVLFLKNEKPFEEVFKDDSLANPSIVRKKLKKYKLLEYKCVLCGNIGEHLNKPLTLQMDHINGKNNDHRLENLRWLCPNCHCQTDTHSGKKKPRLCKCGERIITKRARKCKKCKSDNLLHNSKPKIVWPSDEELSKLVNTVPMIRIAKLLGVSDNAIRKRCGNRNIEFFKRGRGCWKPDIAATLL